MKNPKAELCAEMHLQNSEKHQSKKTSERSNSVCAKRNFIGRSPHHLRLVATSFEAMPQHRSFVPQAAMKLPLRANDVACATQMMLCLRHK